MTPYNDERAPGGGRVLGKHPGDGANHGQRNPPRHCAAVEVARLRAQLRRMAMAAGRTVRTRADEAEHLAARRAGELARMKAVGE